MAHLCKCIICGEQFDRDKIPAVRYPPNPRRYAHQTCYPEGESAALPPKPKTSPPAKKLYKKEEPAAETQADKESRKDLLDYISTHMSEPNYARIQLQINEYTQLYGYTYSGIKKTLIYFYEVLKGDDEKGKGGIGIVPYIYQDAYKYFLQIYQAKKANEDKKPEEFLPESFEVRIKPPAPQRKKNKLFELEE